MVCAEYLRKRKLGGAKPVTMTKITRYLGKTCPTLGSMAAAEISAADLPPILCEEEAKEHYETANRLRTYMGQVFRYAVATQRAERNPAADLRDALITPTVTHRPVSRTRRRSGALCGPYADTEDMSLSGPRSGFRRIVFCVRGRPGKGNGTKSISNVVNGPSRQSG